MASTVQLIVLGFEQPDFHGEIIAELERLRESDTVRVIDALAVYKDAAGEFEVEHLSNLSEDEAIELGSKVGALVGLGIEGEEGLEAGAEAGAEAAADGVQVFSDDDAWDVLEEIPNDSAAALVLIEHHWAVPLRDAVMRAGGFRIADGFISPLDLVEIGLVTAEEAEQLHAHETAAAARTDRAPIEETRHVRITQSRTTHRPPHRTTRLTAPLERIRTSRAPPSRGAATAPVLLDLLAERVPARSRLRGDLVPLAPDLVLGRPLAPADAIQLIVDLAAGRCRADEDDHDAEERRDHGEDRADHAVAGGVRVEEMRDVHRRADRVHREQHRLRDAEREEVRRAIRLALSTRPLQTRNTAVTGASSSAAASSRRLRPSAAWMTPLTARYAVSPTIQSSPLNVLRTLSGSSSQACSNSRCTARVKLSTATRRKKNPTTPRLVLLPDGGAKTSLTASAPPPVSS